MILLLQICLATILFASTAGESWVTFGGNHQHHNFMLGNIPKSAASFVKVWDYSFPDNWGQSGYPLVYMNSIFVTENKGRVYKLDGANGKLLDSIAPSVEIGGTFLDPETGRLFVKMLNSSEPATSRATIAAYELDTLDRVWSSNQAFASGLGNLQAIAHSPKAMRLYFAGGDNVIRGAIDQQGALEFKTPLGASSNRIYGIAAHESGEKVFVTHTGGLSAIDARRGTVIWRYNFDEYSGLSATGIPQLTPLLYKNLVIISQVESLTRNRLVAIHSETKVVIWKTDGRCQISNADFTGPSTDGELVYQICPAENKIKAFKYEDGSLVRVFSDSTLSGITQPPIVTEHFIVAVTQYGRVAFDKASGTKIAADEVFGTSCPGNSHKLAFDGSTFYTTCLRSIQAFKLS